MRCETLPQDFFEGTLLYFIITSIWDDFDIAKALWMIPDIPPIITKQVEVVITAGKENKST